MADEIKFTSGLVITKESTKLLNLQSQTLSATLTGSTAALIPMTIGTSHEVIATGDITDDGGFGMIVNLSTTATVQVGVDVAATFYPLITVPPSERSGPFRWADISAAYVVSDEASTNIQVATAEL